MSAAPPAAPETPRPENAVESASTGKPGSSGAAPSAAPSAAPPTPRPALDGAVGELQARRDEWAALPVAERVVLLDRLAASFRAVAGRWVEASRRLEGTLGADAFHGEEWLAGPYCVLRNIRLLRESLDDLAAGRAPRLPGAVETRADGRVVAPVFPASLWDRLFFPGVHAEVWMQPGVTTETVAENQGLAYRTQGACGDDAPGRVALVLGAGNVSSIGPMDVLYKLFVELQVVLYKSHPVQDPLGPLFEEAFAPLTEPGYLRVVYGGAEVGEYLVSHEGVDEIHVTGSDKTYETIVFGAGEEGERRKREDRPRLTKRFTAELGNVSPVIVVPGPWSPSDVAYQAENLVSMMANNAGFNCNAVRVVIFQQEWPQRTELVSAVRRVLAATPTRPAYYPGAAERFEALVAAHPKAELFGDAAPGELPWALLPDLDPAAEDDPAFRMEAFCGLFGETALPAPSAALFLDRAVEFANERLWGTLNATILIHPDSLEDPVTAAAFDRAMANLRFGTITVNAWAGIGYAMGTTTWGAYPGHTAQDIQSGHEVVHNTYLFDRPEKSIVRAPFRSWPKPPWFVTHRTAGPLGRDLTRFEAQPSPFKLPGIFLSALRG